MLKTVISREETRNENMIIEYTKKLETLPRGKITPKTINGKTYYYLYYRDGKKIVSKYIGKEYENKRFCSSGKKAKRISQIDIAAG